ncbi:MAG: DUF86 domain-containing protein [Anaerolineae bacterium]|nr:DUF86 domain-containing protein [Anaerolineae bacterium]
MTTNQDRVYLIYVLECIANIEELTESGRAAFETAKHTRAAVLYYLQTMAESTQRLSDTLKSTQPDIDWIGISGFRNRLVHGYLDMNVDILWNVIEHDLPKLKLAIEAMLKTIPDNTQES